jgi:hypothetical protein
MDTYNVVIVNNKKQFFEYNIEIGTITNIKEFVFKAVDLYIENILGYEVNFTVPKTFWQNKLKLTVVDSDISSTTGGLVSLVNSLTKNKKLRIFKIYGGYSSATSFLGDVN